MSDGYLWDVVVEGEEPREGSSYPWRGGTATYIVDAGSGAEALLEVLEGLGNHGKIIEEGGDCEWVSFSEWRETTFRVSPVPSAEAGRDA